jgi:hypothetical protein
MDHTVLDPNGPLFVASSLTWLHGLDILVRLLCAFGLGAFVAYRPWRALIGHRGPRVSNETAQTQSIIAVAGALLVVVIGDSLARAFGLVGLGTFIRFRAGVKDPRDVAVILVMIGIGMACGLGLVGTGAVGTLFVSAVLLGFDRFAPPGQRLTILVGAPDPAAVREAVRAAFPGARAVEMRFDEAAGGRAAFSIATHGDEDALAILEALRKNGAAGVKSVRIEEG